MSDKKTIENPDENARLRSRVRELEDEIFRFKAKIALRKFNHRRKTSGSGAQLPLDEYLRLRKNGIIKVGRPPREAFR